MDYRRLTPSPSPSAYAQVAFFGNVAAAEAGNFAFAVPMTSRTVDLVLQNLGLFAQDTWHLRSRLTLTYGLRWDVDFAPKTTSGPDLPAIVNFNNPSDLALAAAGTPPFSTTHGNL